VVVRQYKRGMSEKYSCFKENIVYLSLMLTIILTFFKNAESCLYDTIILMFSREEYMYNSNWNYVNICYCSL